MILLAVVLAVSPPSPPRIDVSGTEVDWFRGVVSAQDIIGPREGRKSACCLYCIPPSERAAKAGAVDALFLRIMTLPIEGDCTGNVALLKDPSLWSLVRAKASSSAVQIGAETWRGDATIVLDVELIRAFKRACTMPDPIPESLRELRP